MPVFSRVNNFAYGSYLNSVNKVSDAMKRLSTGLKRPSATDGRAIDGLAADLQQKVTGNNAIKQYLQIYESYASTQDSFLSGIQDMMDDLTSLAAASTAATSDNDRDSLQVEFRDILDQMRLISDTARFKNRDLFGSDSSFTVRLGLRSANSTLFSGIYISTMIDTLSGAAVSTAATASGALGTISAQLSVLNLWRTRVGNHASIVQRAMLNIENLVTNLQDAHDVLVEADQAEVTADYVKQSVALDASMAALVQGQGLIAKDSLLISNLLS